MLVSGGDDFAIRMWDVQTGKELFQLKGHTHLARALAWSRDGKYIVTGGHDATIRLWDARTGKFIKTLGANHNILTGLMSTPDGQKVVSCAADGAVVHFHNSRHPRLQV